MKQRMAVSVFVLLCSSILTTVFAAEQRADRIVVVKSTRTMTLYTGQTVLRAYKISLGNPLGPKTRQGDRRTPEGTYVISGRNPQSQFHKSLRISYPNAQDVQRARKLRVNPGGDIMIHGLPNGYGRIGKRHLLHDWTDGCIAVTDEEVDEIWRLVPNGTTIEIKP